MAEQTTLNVPPLRTGLAFVGRWFVLAVAALVLVMALVVWADVADALLAGASPEPEAQPVAPTPAGKTFSY
jgi:hypothetical protein